MSDIFVIFALLNNLEYDIKSNSRRVGKSNQQRH